MLYKVLITSATCWCCFYGHWIHGICTQGRHQPESTRGRSSPPHSISLRVCLLAPTAQLQSHSLVQVSSFIRATSNSQHKSFMLPRLNLSQDTKESFLGICNKTLRGFRGLTATYCYSLKPNPTHMGQKAPCPQHLPLPYPSTTQHATTGDMAQHGRTYSTISCSLQTSPELHNNTPQPSLRPWAPAPATNFRRGF